MYFLHVTNPQYPMELNLVKNMALQNRLKFTFREGEVTIDCPTYKWLEEAEQAIRFMTTCATKRNVPDVDRDQT